MRSLAKQLSRRKQSTYQKLKSRFLRNLETGQIEDKTRREKFFLVRKIQKLERQLGIRSTTRLKHWALAAAFGLISVMASAQTVPFRPEPIPSDPLANSKMAVADFDGDGTDDFVAFPDAGDVNIWLNDGNGNFDNPTPVEPVVQNFNQCITGRFEGLTASDGDTDIIINEEYGASTRLRLLANDGTGSFTSTQVFQNDSVAIIDVQTGDFDVDGDEDLMIQFESPYYTRYFLLNQGDNTFDFDTLQFSLPTNYQVLVGDFDEDGDDDLMSFFQASGLHLRIYYNDSTLTFPNVQDSYIGLESPNTLTSGDIDKDGDLDIIYYYQAGSFKYVDIVTNDGANDGLANFSNIGGTGFGYNDVNNITFIDADGDANVDLLVEYYYELGETQNRILSNTGSGFSLDPQRFDGKLGEFDRAYVFDADGDGDDDVLGAGSYEVGVFTNDGTGNITLFRDDIINPLVAYRTEVVDIDNDGDLDVIGNVLNQVFLNDGSGNFTVNQTLAHERGFTMDHLSLGDLDGDTFIDLVFSGESASASYNEYIQVGLNDGAGNIVLQPIDTITGSGSDGIFFSKLVNFDADADLELIIFDYSNGPTSARLIDNDGSGNLLSPGPGYTVYGLYDVGDVDTADVDGDGDVDLIAGGNNSTLIYNNGDGSFSYYGGHFAIDGFDSEGLDVADFDSDGDLDVVFSNLDSGYVGYNFILRNDSSAGQFSPISSSMSLSLTQDVIAADFNMDTHPDLFVGSYPAQDELLLNDGSTGFILNSDGVTTSTSFSLKEGDFDGDGDIDIFSFGVGARPYIIFNDLIAAPVFEDIVLDVDENPPNGLIIDTLRATDVNGDLLTYSILSGNASGAFALNDSILSVNDSALFDFESLPIFTLSIEASDGSLSDVATVTVNLNDVNEAPNVSDTVFAVLENRAVGIVIGTVEASDPENDPLQFSISSGNDDNTFEIDINSGNISIADSALFDFDLTPVRLLTIQVTDGALATEADVSINLLSTAPAFTDQSLSLNENPIDGAVVGQIVASDPDDQVLFFEILSGNDGNAFTISDDNILVNDSSSIDFESQPQFVLTVRASNNTDSTEAIVTIDVLDINEKPVIDAVPILRSDQDAVNGTVVGTVTADDPEDDQLHYSILSGNTGDAFSIDSLAGDITVNDNSVIIYETQANYFLTVAVTDGVLMDTANVEIRVVTLARDKDILLSLFDATDGSNWADATNWSEANPLTDEWFGISIINGRVSAIELPENQLSGAVPIELQDMTGLQTINFSGNQLTDFPDVTNLTLLNELDLKNNLLGTNALIRNVSVTGYDFSPQNLFGIAQTDTIPEGIDYEIVLETRSSQPGDTYQWYFNDVLIGGAQNSTYTITGIGFEEMGKYHIEITNDALSGLIVETNPLEVLAETDILGNVTLPNGSPIPAGQVELFRIAGGPFIITDSAQISSTGGYILEEIVLGDFIINVKPDRSVVTNSILQTYYSSTDAWLEADTLRLREEAQAIDITMVSYAPPVVVPTGAEFEGELFTDFEDDGARTLARRKVQRAGCSLRRFVGSGRTEQEGEYELFAYVESDDDGNFDFPGIPAGSYRLNIEYPGVPMDENSDIFFEVSADKENQLFQLTALVTEDGIKVEAFEVLFSDKPYLDDLNLYPNPTDGLVQMDYRINRKIDDLTLQVHDIRGVEVMTKSLSTHMGTYSLQMDLSTLEEGIYIVVLSDSAGNFRKEVKVSKL